MYKKKIKYTDFNGNEQEKDFLFNLTRPELTSLSLNEFGGYEENIMALMDNPDPVKFERIVREFILCSYGIKSPDGEYFDKSPEIRNRFEHSAAFDALYVELASNTDELVKFINSIVPESVKKSAEKKQAELLNK